MPGIHLLCIYSWKNYKLGLSKKGLELSVSGGMCAEGSTRERGHHPPDRDCSCRREGGTGLGGVSAHRGTRRKMRLTHIFRLAILVLSTHVLGLGRLQKSQPRLSSFESKTLKNLEDTYTYIYIYTLYT